MRGRHRAVALALACALLAASPEPPFTARVKSIVDGDTLVVSREQSLEVRVRLFGIDCPEGDQPYGDRARAELAELVKGREVRVEPTDRDDWGRTVARISVGGLDVNAELVRAGAAWVFLRYSHDPKLIALESEARAAHRGLWGLADPVPPWDWRHPEKASFKCGAKHSCREMKSCAEARFYLRKCGVTSLDGNGDGVPCASLCR